VAYRCINSSCPAQLERSLLHFASRQAMDIEGMGEAVVAQLVALKLVRTPADVYALSAQDLSRLELFKEKKTAKLLEAIEESKQRPLARLIFALGIRNVGEKASFTLAQRFGSMDALMAASPEELDVIPEIGAVMAASVADYFSLPQTRTLISALRKAGVRLKEDAPASEAPDNPLKGKRVVFTGTLQGLSRTQAQEMLRQRGGVPVESVSGQTDYLVAGESPGSKYKKAEQQGVTIISEAEFIKLLEART
jgi:DNA ligase (NAD+)